MHYNFIMTTLSIRIEEKTKKEAQRTLESLGIDLSSAVKMFLHQVILEQGIPFKPSRHKEIRRDWDEEVAWALKNGKRYSNAKDMHKIIFGK
jgi:DNA-damage-inducible protein J